jgi:hypothetical protein
MEKQDKIIYAVLGLGVAYFAFQFIFRKANYTKECEKELATAKFESEEARQNAILECIMAKKTKNDAK